MRFIKFLYFWRSVELERWNFTVPGFIEIARDSLLFKISESRFSKTFVFQDKEFFNSEQRVGSGDKFLTPMLSEFGNFKCFNLGNKKLTSNYLVYRSFANIFYHVNLLKNVNDNFRIFLRNSWKRFSYISYFDYHLNCYIKNKVKITSSAEQILKCRSCEMIFFYFLDFLQWLDWKKWLKFTIRREITAFLESLPTVWDLTQVLILNLKLEIRNLSRDRKWSWNVRHVFKNFLDPSSKFSF